MYYCLNNSALQPLYHYALLNQDKNTLNNLRSKTQVFVENKNFICIPLAQLILKDFLKST